MGKNDGQIRQDAAGTGLAADMTKTGVSGAKEPTPVTPPAPPAVEQAPVVSALALRAINEPHKVARDYLLAAAKLCGDSTKLVSTSAENVRRLIRIAMAHVEGL